MQFISRIERVKDADQAVETDFAALLEDPEGAQRDPGGLRQVFLCEALLAPELSDGLSDPLGGFGDGWGPHAAGQIVQLGDIEFSESGQLVICDLTGKPPKKGRVGERQSVTQRIAFYECGDGVEKIPPLLFQCDPDGLGMVEHFTGGKLALAGAVCVEILDRSPGLRGR